MISATTVHMTAVTPVVNSKPDDPGTTTKIIKLIAGINIGLIAVTSGLGNQTHSCALFSVHTFEILGRGNPCAPHHLNKSTTAVTMYITTITT